MIVAVTDLTDVMASDDLRLARSASRIRFVVVSVSDLFLNALRSLLPRERPRRDGRRHRRGRGAGTRGHHRGRRRRRARDQTDEPDHRRRDRRGRLGHPLRAAATGDGRPCPHRRRHAPDRRGADRPDARRHEPPEDHGRARHRRPPHGPGRPRLDPLRRHPVDLRAVLPTTFGEKVVLRILHRASGRLDLRPRHERRGGGGADARTQAAAAGAVLTVGPTGSGKTTTCSMPRSSS